MSTTRPLKGIAGRVALVTGAGQGIGRAIAERLAAEGATVAVNDLNPDTAAEVAAAIGGVAAPFDCADRAAVHAALEQLARDVGTVELAVANHAYMTMAPFIDEDPGDWQRTLDVNLKGTLWVLQATARQMVPGGYGRIVCISSEWGLTGWPEAGAYTTSKGGIVSLVRSAARALGPRGIAVNGIAPGVTATPQLQVDADAAGISYDEMVAIYAKDVPLGRIARPADIAAVAAYLVSEPAAALVGQVISPNGGSLI
jgi:NAD(P)-dependent dehydrogenase (short-subunit alcohol dehydrogenase family)